MVVIGPTSLHQIDKTQRFYLQKYWLFSGKKNDAWTLRHFSSENNQTAP